MDTREKVQRLQANVEKVIKGKSEVVKLAIVALLAKGHLLIEDVPGVGKTTLAQSLARSLDCSFRRIQFTSDLLPSDILGVSIYDPEEREFVFKQGPIFSNIVLADEINRATPKTQSSLLEAMNEFQVSLEGKTIPLPRPFLVLATQNPTEYYGTYPLPESQLDRFIMRIRMGYPSVSWEKKILQGEDSAVTLENLKSALTADEVLELQREVEEVKMNQSLIDYLMALVVETRKSEFLGLGVSPRGAIFLQRAAHALALIEGRDYCIPDDIKSLVLPIFSHRV
ncbi:MAG: MoxR family ATPase, partial [Candidatus Aminicenantes bacterium]|nr:MoxR family ATPase [Candidatus Aminicenantes bacterium]